MTTIKIEKKLSILYKMKTINTMILSNQDNFVRSFS